MEHLIPTLLGTAGALAPIALGYWKQEQPIAVRTPIRPSRLVMSATQLTLDDAVVRGGRVYL
jgi:hypothetical protein